MTIGIADISQPYWKTFADLAQQKLGVTVKYVNFTDYSQPNPRCGRSSSTSTSSSTCSTSPTTT